MKNRYGRVLRPGQNGDYMLRSRTRSGSEEHEPMTIEYCSNYEELLPNDMPPTEVTIDQLAAEAFTEEFQLIQSGDFVLTAPSCNNPAYSHDRSLYRSVGLEEQRELPPPEVLRELGRSQTMSFDVDFPSIEKTYTTFINVAEDQIYPLEWKDFLEVAREEDDRLMPLSKERKGSPRKTSEVKKTLKAGSTVIPSIPVATQNAPSNASSHKDVADSESLNSDARKFRLFPNIRDVASRRTKRMEAARSRRRLLDGKNDSKREKKDRIKREKESVGIPGIPSKGETKNSVVTEHDRKSIQSFVKVDSPPTAAPINAKPVPRPNKADPIKQTSVMLKSEFEHKATAAEIKASPTNGEIGLQELAEKIIGKDVRKSEDVDFTKRKRNGKKKKSGPVIHNSTSFPADFSSETMWDVTKSSKEVLLSQDDEIVTYDQDQAVVDNSDAANVMPGVETIFSDHIDSKNGHSITLEAREEPVTATEKKLTADNLLPAFALSKSFDDLYHSFVVKSIKKEIEAPQIPPSGSVPEAELPKSPMSEAVPHAELKWFGFGKQLWHQTSPTREIAEDEAHLTVEEGRQSNQARDTVPAASFATSLSDILRSEISSISQAAKETPSKVSTVSKGDAGDKVAAPIDVSTADENEHLSVVSVHTENEDEEVESVASSTMTPVYPSFILRAGSWLTRFGAKANGLVACAQNPFGDSRVSKRSRKSKKIVAAPSLDHVNENSPTETRDDIEEVHFSVSRDGVSRVDSRASSVSINSVASSKTFDSDHSDSSSSEEEENASRTSSYDSADNVEVGWCG